MNIYKHLFVKSVYQLWKKSFIFHSSKGNLLDYPNEKTYCKKKLLKNMSAVLHFWPADYWSRGFIFSATNQILSDSLSMTSILNVNLGSASKHVLKK